MAEESVFLCYVRHILKKWAGFQAAIDSGIAGPYAKEKEDWLAVEVEKYFKLYKGDVQPDEIEDYIDQMLNDEFDTICDDESLKDVSSKFCQAYRLSLSNPDDEIFHEMKKAKTLPCKPNKLSKPQACKEEITPVSSVTEEIRDLVVDDDNEGWTTVSSRHKKQIVS